MAGNDFLVNIVGNVTGFDVAPINNLNNSLKQLPPTTQQAASAGQQLSSSFNTTAGSANSLNSPLNQVSTTTQATGQHFTATGALANNFGTTLVGTSGKAQQLVGSNSALGNSFAPVQGGLNGTNTLLAQNADALTNTSTKSEQTSTSTISLGEKIGLLGGFITSTIGTVFGLVEGLTGLEAAQVAADRAQQRVNTSALAAEKAQDAYNKIVAKFGPDSKQAQEALANLENKTEANRIAQDRAEVSQKKLTEGYVSFGIEVISAAGELVQMGSTISILIGRLGLHAAATTLSTEANVAMGASGGIAAAGEAAEADAALAAGVANEESAAATSGLTAEYIALAAPLIAAAALFVLIETNTFGMGDAFRTITPQIGSAIDAIVNGLALISNALVRGLQVVLKWGQDTDNTLIGVYNSFNKFFDQVVVGFTNLGADIQNAVSQIPNFFINNLINPVIRAWNSFNEGLAEIWQATTNKIVDLFKPAAQGIINVIKTIVDAGAQIPGAFGDAFRSAKESVDKAAESLTKMGSTATSTGGQVKTGLVTPIKELEPIATGAFQHITTSGLYPLSTATVDVSGAIKSLDGAIITNAGNIKTGATAFLNYASHGNNLATIIKSQVVPGLASMISPITSAIGGLTGMGGASDAAGEGQSKFTGKVGEATKAVKTYSQTLDEATAKTQTEAAGIQQAVAAHEFMAKALADTSKELQDAASKQQELTTKLTDGTAIQNRYNTAIIDGTNKYLDLIVKTQDAATSQQQYNDLLTKSGAGQAALSLGLEATSKNMELVAKAALGDVDAFNTLQDSVSKLFEDFNKLGDTVSSKLAEALDKGKKAWNKSLKELSDETGVSFDQLGETMALKVDAGMQKANKTLDTDLGVLAVLIRQHAPNIGEATNEMIDQLAENIKNADPTVKAAWNKIFDDMRTIAAQPIPTAASLGKLQQDIQALHLPADQANSIMATLRGTLGGVGTQAGTAAGTVDQFSSSVQQAGALATVWQVTIQNIAVAFNTGFTRAIGDASGQLIILEQNATLTFTAIIAAIAQVAVGFNEGFTRAVADATGQMVVLETNIADAFVNIITALGQLTEAFTTAFNTATLNAGTAMNSLSTNINGNVANWIKDINTFVTALTNDFNVGTRNAGTAMNSLSTNINGNVSNWDKAINAFGTTLVNTFNTGTRNAGTAMNSLATNVSTNASNMASSLSRVVSMFNNITSSINSSISAVRSLISAINSIPSSKTVNVNIIQHVTQVVRQVPAGLATAAATGAPAGSAGAASTTVLTPGIASNKRVIVEVREPTVIKIDSRELIKIINKKLLELDLGALA